MEIHFQQREINTIQFKDSLNVKITWQNDWMGVKYNCFGNQTIPTRERGAHMNTETKVKEIICDLLSVEMDELQLTTDLRADLQADSLDFTEIVMQIEDDFEIETEEEDMVKIKTVGDIVNYIEAKK